MFKFKGISSTDMQVVIEEEEHFIAKASKRYEITEIEGRDGAIFDELGYSYVERPIYVQCLNIDKIDDILAWLDGEGEFEYKERKTIARFYSQLDPQREGYIRIIDTTFIRAPFWTKADDELVTVKDSKVVETEESKSIHIEDASTIPAQLEILGNQEQDGEPSSENPVEVKCLKGSTKISKINKNFLNLNNLAVANNNGIDTYSIDNANRITLKNRATSDGTPYSYSFQAFKLNLPAGNYNLSAKVETNSANYRIIIRGKKDGSNTTSTEVVSQSKNNGNFNIDYSQCDEYTIEFYANQAYVEQLVTTIYSDIQIEIDITTDYVEHKQTDYILDIQQEMLQGDYFVKEADSWKEVHTWKKYIFTGTESRWNNNYGTSLFNIQYLLTDINQTKCNALCNYFKYNAVQSGINNATVNGEFAIQLKTTHEIGNIFFKNETFSNVDDWKNWLQEKYDSGNPLVVYYPLETPTKLACTEQQSAVLEELSNLDLFEGVNNIITAEDIALLKLSYIQQTNEKIKNEGNIESRPILRLEKTIADSVELTINNCRFKYNFNNEEYVEIDCEEKEVQYEGLNRNRQIEIGYDFPILNVGNNDIKMHLGDCIIKVLRKDRWL